MIIINIERNDKGCIISTKVKLGQEEDENIIFLTNYIVEFLKLATQSPKTFSDCYSYAVGKYGTHDRRIIETKTDLPS
jgi:hypothetical protein